MKDSGISWVGEIPKEWSVKKIKHISYVIGGNGFNVELQGLESGDYPFCKASDISNAGKYLDKAANYVTFDIVRDQHYNIIPKGAILFPKIGEAMKKNNRTICVLDCCADNNCQAIVPFERNSGMFLYYILTCVNMGWFDNAGTIPCMNNRKFLNSKVPFPSLVEQQRIAEFLDRECGKIDGLKADIQAQIDTLEQYKRSVITEAVTHGLNPSAPMKDSGAGWMPLIPLHWKADKLKFHLRQRGIKNQIDKQVLSLYREYGIVPKDSRDDNHNVTSEDVSDYRYVRVGDFVVNKMKAWQGSVAVSNYEGIVSPAYFVYEFSDDLINKRYFHYLMRNKTYATEFRRLSGGIREGQWDLPSEALNNTIILLPPLDEQQEIADYLDNKCAEIEQIIADKKSQIETLDGYKKSLIYEYVTGKKEVYYV
jgi:restriction modification system DNA specificity domain protein